MSSTTQLYYLSIDINAVNAADGAVVDDTLSNGTTVSSISAVSYETQLGTSIIPTDIVLVPQDNVYFISAQNSTATNSYIYEETFGSAANFSQPILNLSSNFDIVAMAVDTVSNNLYFSANNDLYVERFGSSFTNKPTLVNLGSLGLQTDQPGNYPLLGDVAMGYDASQNALFYADATGSVSSSFGISPENVGSNNIYKVTGLGPSATAANITTSRFASIPDTDGLPSSAALDTANDTLYFTTSPLHAPNGAFLPNAEAGIFALALSGANAGQITTVYAVSVSNSTPAASPFRTLGTISVDSVTGEYYVEVREGTTPTSGVILDGNVNNIGVAPTTLTNTGITSNGQNGQALPIALAVDSGPSIVSARVLAIDGSTSKTSGEVSHADTVTFAVTFNEAATISATPTLTLNDGGAAIYASGSGTDVLLFTYTPTTVQNAATLGITGIGGTITDDIGTSNASTLAASFAGLRVDDTPPSLSLSGTSAEALQGGGTVTLLSGTPVITDPFGTGTLTGAEVSIASAQSGDVLAISGTSSGALDGGAISFAASGGVLTLSGSASLAQYETALSEITYQDSGTASGSGSHPARVLNWSVSEGGLTSAVQATNLTIDRPPSAPAGGIAATLAEGAVLTLGAGSALAGVSDPDGDALTIIGASGAAGFAASGSALTGTYGVLTLDANGAYSYTASNSGAINAAAQGAVPDDLFHVTIADGHGGFATEALSIAIDRALTLSGGGALVTYDTGPAAIDPGLTLNDPDGAMLTGATIAIASGLYSGDELLFTAQNNISGSYNAATGVLVLSGTDNAADYQAALNSISFDSTNIDASNNQTDTLRNISYVVSDAAGSSNAAGSDVFTLCFVQGTRIASANGTVNVEDLAIGDAVVTRSGGLSRIKWLGRQSFGAAFMQANREKIPVRIQANALGQGLPLRDLFVSPGHSLLLGNRLVLARNLVNGLSITQDAVNADVHYLQIELEAHDCVLAEGCWSESYADGPGLRAQFHNAAEFWALYPEYQTPDEVITCLPRPLAGPDLAAALAPVVARAAASRRPGALHGWLEDILPNGEIIGWAQDSAAPELPVELIIMLGGRTLGTILACDPRDDLRDAKIGRGHCAFSFQYGRALTPCEMSQIELYRAADSMPLPRLRAAAHRAA